MFAPVILETSMYSQLSISTIEYPSFSYRCPDGDLQPQEITATNSVQAKAKALYKFDVFVVILNSAGVTAPARFSFIYLSVNNNTIILIALTILYAYSLTNFLQLFWHHLNHILHQHNYHQ